MTDQLKNLLIGVFVLAAIASAVFIILFLEPTVGDGKELLHVRFSTISGINVGTRVSLAGKAVGEVVSIKVIPKARQEMTDELGRVYFYELTLKVDSSVKVYDTDEIAIQTTGLLGEKSINIIPKASKKGQVPKLVTDKIIYGDSVEPLENAVVQISKVAETMEEAIGNFDQWFSENQESLSLAVQSFADAMKNVDITVDEVNKQQLVASVKDAIDTFTDNMKLIESSLNEVQDKEMLAKFNVILDNFSEASKALNTDGRQILSNMNIISQDIADGTGTIGKLVKSDDLYLRITAVMSKVDTLMNDVNHYGILFQYDKHWQRIRTKRANLLEALNTPSEFKNYFETEMDGITTSLGRLSMLLEKAEQPKEKTKIMNSEDFKKDFATLLRQTEDLLDSLKLYNEELVESIDQ